MPSRESAKDDHQGRDVRDARGPLPTRGRVTAGRTTVEIDVNGDGFGEFPINFSSTNTLWA